MYWKVSLYLEIIVGVRIVVGIAEIESIVIGKTKNIL